MGIDDLAVSGEEGSRLARQDPDYFRLTAEEWEKLDRFIQSRTDLRFSTGTQAVYRLRSIPRPDSISLPGGSIPDLLKLLKTQDPKA
jgi:hypothetical protein